MIAGLQKFRDHFANHEHQYVLIGGAACDLLFGQAGLPFRATKDLDIVLIIEAIDTEFTSTFATFVETGDYRTRERADGGKEYFRFLRPAKADYPFMIELFSRRPAGLAFSDDLAVARLSVQENVFSLSAILLDDDYYAAIQSARTVINGVPIIDESLLIPFKARAFLDLVERKAKGSKVDGKDIKKHRNDVFRLLQLLPQDQKIALPPSIRGDLKRFVELVENDESIDPKSFDVVLNRVEAMQLLRNVFRIS